MKSDTTHVAPAGHPTGLLARVTTSIEGAPLSGQATLVSLCAGVTVGALAVAECLSFALLMFGGIEPNAAGLAFWTTLTGLIGASVLVATRLSLAPNAAGPDSAATALLAVLAPSVTAAMAARGFAPVLAVPHMLILMTAAGLTAGMILYLLGRFRLANAVRYIPYPVVSGFTAGAGLLLLAGAARIAFGGPIGGELLRAAPSDPRVWCLIVTIAFAAVLRLAGRVSANPLLVPLLAVAATGAIWQLTLMPRFAHFAPYWYLQLAADPLPWTPIDPRIWRTVDWGVLARLLPETIAVGVVLVINFVGKISGLELIDGKSSDVNRDMCTIGVANGLLAPFGGVPVSLWGTGTRSILTAAGGTRLSVFVIALVGVAALVIGDSFVRAIPLPILAGFVLFGGYSVLMAALARPLKHRNISDLLLLGLVTVICLKYGYLFGVLLGMSAAAMLFAMNYSRVGLVRRHMSRANFAGPVVYAPETMRALAADGHAIQMVWLSGYMFFGSSEGLFRRVRAAIDVQSARRVDTLILDLSGVTGADASALSGLAKIQALLKRNHVSLIMTGVSAPLVPRLAREGVANGKDGIVISRSMAEAIALAETRLMVRLDLTPVAATTAAEEHDPAVALAAWLSVELATPVTTATVARHFQSRQLERSHVLYRAGDAADSIDFVESGRLSISVTDASGALKTLRQTTSRTVVGEMGFFGQRRRTATVTVDEACRVHTLARSSYEVMLRDHPELATAILEYLARTLSDRLVFSNKTYGALA